MIRFEAMPTGEARAYQAGKPDANGQIPERHVSGGDGVPCRHCQEDVAKGGAYLILSYRPFPVLQPYAESGPIFLHAEPCKRFNAAGEPPPMFFANERRYLIKGYNSEDRIVYGTGKIVEPADMRAAAEAIFARDGVKYIHVRSALNNCYQCRIDRA
jgi:hypothetical protein